MVYDGPDLDEVAGLTGLSREQVIERHAATEYLVGWLGFSPGFGYLTGLDPELHVPRRDSPRTSVPAGSVAIAGPLAAVYPSASPGGWRLLGRTAAQLWDARREPPAVLAPGQRVRFRPVDELGDPGDLFPPGTRTSDEPEPATERFIEVVRPGPFAIVADLGRPGYGHLGVPRSGAADPDSLRLANRLVGNPEDAAVVELTLGGATLRFAGRAGSAPAWVAVTGAAASVRLAPGPAPGPGQAAGSEPGRRQRAGGAVRGAERGHAHGGNAGHGGAQLSGRPGRRDCRPGAGQPFGGHAVRDRAVAAAGRGPAAGGRHGGLRADCGRRRTASGRVSGSRVSGGRVTGGWV